MVTTRIQCFICRRKPNVLNIRADTISLAAHFLPNKSSIISRTSDSTSLSLNKLEKKIVKLLYK
jgi:hypothetical protein